jgi:hypothetical protein
VTSVQSIKPGARQNSYGGGAIRSQQWSEFLATWQGIWSFGKFGKPRGFAREKILTLIYLV